MNQSRPEEDIERIKRCSSSICKDGFCVLEKYEMLLDGVQHVRLLLEAIKGVLDILHVHMWAKPSSFFLWGVFFVFLDH
jgi:hypothetical protein